LSRRLHILFLPRWYPHRYDPMPGLFIQRQAEALTSVCEVAVLYVHADNTVSNRYEIDIAEENKVHVVRVYYKDSQIPVLKGVLKILNFCKAHRIGLKTLRSFQPDLVHVHVLTREGIIALWNKMRTGVPYVITEHWSRYLQANNTFKGAFRKWMTRRVVKSSAAMIAVSESLRKAMQDIHLENKNFRVIPNPVDTSLFIPGTFRKESTTRRFIHISCFEDRPKNISGLLNAVKSLSVKRSDFECVFIGDGPELNLWKSKADQMGMLDKNVFFPGMKENNDLVKEIQTADFMVLSSNYETFGTVVIECLSCGIPIVATNVGIVPEVINQTNGIIIPAGNTLALENGIKEMLDECRSYDPNLIRNSILNKFDSQTISNQLLEIYQKAINQHQKK
jgi:glycosyltransferase involved in cell wall biosynthesis